MPLPQVLDLTRRRVSRRFASAVTVSIQIGPRPSRISLSIRWLRRREALGNGSLAIGRVVVQHFLVAVHVDLTGRRWWPWI